jgi:hypothetical protein
VTGVGLDDPPAAPDGPDASPAAAAPPVPARPPLGFWDHLKNDLTVAVAVVAGIMLGTGYILTWARLVSASVPSQAILTSLPRTYFVDAAFQSMLSPLVIATLLGGLWVPAAMWAARQGSQVTAVVAWGAWGALLGLVSVTVARSVSSQVAFHGPPLTVTTGVMVLVSGFVVAALATVMERRRLPPRDSVREGWRLARPILAFTVALCFAVPCAVRIIDVFRSDGALPYAAVISREPCARLTNGSAVLTPRRPAGARGGKPTVPGSCAIGGYYLGANDHWIFLAQVRNPCPGALPQPSQLTMIRRDEVSAVVSRSGPPGCGP